MTSVCPAADTPGVIHRPGATAARAAGSVGSSGINTDPAKGTNNVTASSTLVEGSHEAIGEIVQLLHQASEQTWQGAAPESPRLSLGHAIYLLQAQLSVLLPDDYDVPLSDGADWSVVQLLRDAERRTWTLPLHRPEMSATSALGIALCDLIREAKHLDR